MQAAQKSNLRGAQQQGRAAAAIPQQSGRVHRRVTGPSNGARRIEAIQQLHSSLRSCAHPTLRGGLTTALKAVKASDASTDGALDTQALQLIADLSRQVDAAVAAIVDANVQAGRNPAPPASTDLKQRVQASIAHVSKGLLERETEVRLMLLAALCGEHLLLLGPPGTAKSELSRRLNALVGGKYFERLLTRFSVPEELFGPLSMRGLENDEYVRQIEGYLPTAEVAFIDEIFKANSAILNALLTLLNERLFDNGNQRLDAPLLTLVGASNELPESEELDALFDRFLVRRNVARVSNANVHVLARLAAGRDVRALIEAASPVTSFASADSSLDSPEVAAAAARLTLDDFRHTASAAYASVDVPDAVIDLLVDLRNWLQDKCEPPVTVSDRRFMKAVQLLQVAAHADGREEVNEYDCLLLEHVFGNRPDDSVKVRSRVLDLISSDPGAQQAELVLLGLFGRASRLIAAAAAGGAEGAAAREELPEAASEASSLVGLLAGRHAGLCGALEGPAGGFPELRACVWQAPGSAQAAAQSLSAQMTENRKKVEELLREAQTLSACLQRATQGGVAAGVVEKLLPKRHKQFLKGIAGAVAAMPAAGSK